MIPRILAARPPRKVSHTLTQHARGAWIGATSVPGQKAKYSLGVDVFRFTPESGLMSNIAPCPFRAMCGRLRVGKRNLHVAGLLGAALCSAFSCGSHIRC